MSNQALKINDCLEFSVYLELFMDAVDNESNHGHADAATSQHLSHDEMNIIRAAGDMNNKGQFATITIRLLFSDSHWMINGSIQKTVKLQV